MKSGEFRAADIVPALPLLAYVVLVPTCTFAASRLSGHDSARLIQLAVLLLATAGFCVRRFRGRQAIRPAPISFSWAAMIVAMLAVASVTASAAPEMALRELFLMIGLGAVVLVTADGLPAAGGASAMAVVHIGSVLYACLLGLLAVASLSSGQALAWADLVVGYDNYRFFNHVQTVAIPLLALAALRLRPKSVGWFSAWYALIVYAVYVCCSGARGTAVALVAAVLVAWPVLGRARVWPLARTLLIVAVAGALVYALVFVLVPQWTGHRLATAERSVASLASDSARLRLWHVALDQAQAHPWLGLGPMHYAHIPSLKAAHPHNIYLQVASEWGAPILVLLLVLVWRALLRMARTVRMATSEAAGTEGTALWVTCAAILLDGAVSGNFVMPVAQMWIALCLAWTLAWNRRQLSETIPATENRSWLQLTGVAMLASQIWLAVTVWPEASDLKAHLEHVGRDHVHSPRTNPRFWSDGWF